MKIFTTLRVDGKEATIPYKKCFKFMGYKLVIHRPLDMKEKRLSGWECSHLRTGLRISHGHTIKETIKLAKEKMENRGRSAIQKALKKKAEEYLNLPNNKEVK